MPIREIYLKLAVGFPRDPKVRALANYGVDGILARDLYVQMCLHCKENLTDGFVPTVEVGVLSYPLPPDHGNQLAKHLASVGLINEVSNPEAQGWQVVAYLRRNGTKEDVEQLSEVRAEAGRKGGRPPRKPAGQGNGKANRNQSGKQNKSRPNPYTETESYTETGQEQEHLVPATPPRGDVEHLCARLADRIEGNGSKRPPVTKEWRDAARRLLDLDGRTEQQILAAIDWCQNDEFWRRNVMSMPTLRKQYDRLRLAAEAQRAAQNGGGRVVDRRQQATDDMFDDAMERARIREANQ